MLSLIVLLACQEAPDAAAPMTDGGAAPPSERVLRRLTRAEYDATVRDLLGIESRYGQAFPPDEVVAGFDNNGRALRVGLLLQDQLQHAAEEIAEQAARDLLQRCSIPQRGEEACARQLIEDLGPRAFRRPLTAADLTRYLGLYRTVAQAGGHVEGAKAVVGAMLQSPHFLYRTELGEPEGDLYRLTPYEVASELSYLLWGSMPDEALLERARGGGLATPAQIEAEARRLLAAPRARAQLDRFLGQWLQIDRLATVPKDDKVYPELTQALRAALRSETGERFAALVRGGGTLGELLRGGLLQERSVLATHATPHSGSPIHRGKLVRERLLCQELPPPPPGLAVQLPAVDPNQSNRERFARHATDAACAACHRLMDPIGFGFERFDGTGRPRDSDGGRPIDARGEIVGAGDASGTFDGVDALARMLAASDEVHACHARQWVRFAFGVDDEDATPLALAATEHFRRAEGRLGELLVGLTQLRRFTHRRPDPGLAPTPAPAPVPEGPPPPPKMDPPPARYTAEIRRDSDWQTGYCSTVTVTNRGAEAGEWRVVLTVEGKINNLWNARSAPEGLALAFTGMDYNKVLAPGASTGFGFCAEK